MGTPDFAVESLQELHNSKHNILAVYTQPDKPAGRGYKLVPPAVKLAAFDMGLPVFQPDTLKTEIDILKNYDPDVIVVVAYGKLLSCQVLDIPKYGCVNVHGSLLPKYRGAAPIQWNIINGDMYGGITTMLMNEGLDCGDILLQAKTKIDDDETCGELFEKLQVMGAKLLLETLDKLEKNEITPTKQDETAATYAPKITKDMCLLNFNDDAKTVHKLICGLSPYPCAYMILKNKKLKLYNSRIVTDISEKIGETGELVIYNKRLIIPCKNNAIEITKLQPENSKQMAAKDYINGIKR